MEEARLAQVGNGLAAVTEGWFVVNARDAPWVERHGFGKRGRFELDGRLAACTAYEPVHFEQLGSPSRCSSPANPMATTTGRPGRRTSSSSQANASPSSKAR